MSVNKDKLAAFLAAKCSCNAKVLALSLALQPDAKEQGVNIRLLGEGVALSPHEVETAYRELRHPAIGWAATFDVSRPALVPGCLPESLVGEMLRDVPVPVKPATTVQQKRGG